MKYILTVNVGYGENTQVLDLDSQEEADEAVFEFFREECDSQHEYSAEPLTRELAEAYGHEDEFDDEEE